MPTRGESISGRTSVDIKARLAAKPERNVGTNGSAHGTLTLIGFRVTAVPPIVIAVDMAAAEVGPWLFFLHHFFAVDAGKCQCVQPHGALGPGCINLLPKSLNVLLSWGVKQAVRCSPQERGTAQINERPIL